MTDINSSENTARFERYNPHEVEKRWREHWRQSGLYKTDFDSAKPKHYAFTMFPYPSGNLHIGHWYSAAVPDTRARFMRMLGHNVFFPMGFDAFGLPAENAAIKNKSHPKIYTYDNIDRMMGQFEQMGTMIDWDAKVITCDPAYYRWNQWFFVNFYKMGLAYKKESFVNWDPVDQTVLANEQVIDGRGDRSGALVERRLMSQWHLRVTNYAEELLDFEGIDWPERVRVMQQNWIGKSVGAEIDFASSAGPIRVFSTRPDTMFGATFMVLAPEHAMVNALTTPENRAAVDAYRELAGKTSEMDRTAEGKEKTGVFLGSSCINPATGKEIPIYISDYVLVTYGTGSVMGVPGQDTRDWDFAKKFNLPIVRTVQPPEGFADAPFLEDGPAINSDFLNGLGVQAAKAKMIEWLQEKNIGSAKTTYRLRDWLISRQRYWGTPIPITYCEKCGEQPVPENLLPVLLPDNVEFLPTGQSPLKLLEDWQQTTCGKCGGPATRDTDTMDTFVDSSWYYYRYLSPNKTDGPIDVERVQHWLPADVYSGGIEHAILHLMYSRFWTKAMRDMGLVKFSEPAWMMRNQGIILGEDNEKMSKSRGNVIDPDDLVAEYGTDTVRLYLQFIGPWDGGGPWAPKGVNGVYNWLGRVWSLFLESSNLSSDGVATEAANVSELEFAIHSAIKKVTEDTNAFKFNTSIAAMMELTNALGKLKRTNVVGTAEWEMALHSFNLLLAPYAPHLAEELWKQTGNTGSVHTATWPSFDPAKLARDTFELVVQVSGKLRGKLEVAKNTPAAELIALAKELPSVNAHVAGKEIVKEIYVPGKLVNIVVKA